MQRNTTSKELTLSFRHASTVPMYYQKDALCLSVVIVTAVRKRGQPYLVNCQTH